VKYNGTEFSGTNAIYASSVSGLSVRNNTIINALTNLEGGYGVHLVSVTNGSISGNRIQTSGTDKSNHGIFLESSSNNSVSGNNVSTRGGGGNYGIYVSSGGYNNVTYNNVSTYGSGNGQGQNHGINVESSPRCVVSHNLISTNGDQSDNQAENVGINIDSSNYMEVSHNTIQTDGPNDNYGINIVGSLNGILSRNTITTNGTNDYGIRFSGDSSNNSVQDSSITASGSGDIFDDSNNGMSNFILNSSFNRSEISFDSGSGGKIFVQNRILILVRDGSSQPVSGMGVRFKDSASVNDSLNPASNLTVVTNSTGWSQAVVNAFLADESHQGPSSYVDFRNYTVQPVVGSASKLNVSLTSDYSGTIEVDSGSILINSSVSTSSKSVEVGSTQTNATLSINTAQDLSGATVSIGKLSQNPGSSNFGVSELGKFLQIEVSSDLSSNMTWAVINMHYTDAEVTAANIDESTLRIQYYNETSGLWEKYDGALVGGVNETGNYVWANTTHFSTFGAFGSAVPAPVATSSQNAGRGRGSGSSIDQSTLGQTPAAAPVQAVEETPVQQPEDQIADGAEEEQDGQAAVGPSFNPPTAQPSSNPITGLFAFGLDANSAQALTGYLTSEDGSPNPAVFLGVISVAIVGSVVYIRRKLIFRKRENKKYAYEGDEAGVAGEAGQREDRDTPEAGGGAEREREEEQKVR